jgi:transcriptional regulator with XRE-family HTH domain
MTPLGQRIRDLRAERGLTLAQMAAALQVSTAYLSALEHGKRGVPTSGFLELVTAYFGLDWDEAEDIRTLAEISKPKVTLDTGGLHPKATELANRLAKRIRKLDEDSIDRLLAQLAQD